MSSSVTISRSKSSSGGASSSRRFTFSNLPPARSVATVCAASAGSARRRWSRGRRPPRGAPSAGARACPPAASRGGRPTPPAPRRAGARAARRSSRGPASVTARASAQPASASVRVTPQARAHHGAALAGQEALVAGLGALTGGTESLHQPPALWATITVPSGQRRRAVCQPAPARLRSSVASGSSALLAPVVAAGGAAAPVLGPGQRAQPGVLARAAVVQAGGGHVAHAPAVLVQAHDPLLLVAVDRHGLVEAPDPLQRRAPHHHVRAPHELGLGVGGAEVQRGHGRALAPARRGAGPSRRARIGPPSASAQGIASAPATSAASQPGGASTSSSTSTTSGAALDAMPVLRAALGPREPRVALQPRAPRPRHLGGVRRAAVVDHHHRRRARRTPGRRSRTGRPRGSRRGPGSGRPRRRRVRTCGR